MNLNPSFKINANQFSNEAELFSYAENLESTGNEYEKPIGEFILDWLSEEEFITVKTSGSTGKPKKILLQKKQMENSALATGNYFELGENSTALLCMSANYIAGKMMLVRAMVLGWDLKVVEPSAKPLENLGASINFAAMVPYQVLSDTENLHKVEKLLIGGGAISSELEKQLQNLDTEVYASYGMTETISHIALRKVNGIDKTTVFSALPNVQFSKDNRDCLLINAALISEGKVITNDVVQLISETQFIWKGRFDNIINSGGIKINPEEVEAKLSPFIEIPFFISSEKDEKLGERLILILQSATSASLSERKFSNSDVKLSDTVKYNEAFEQLSKYERPKKIYSLPKFIFTETGKIKRDETASLIF